MTMTYQPVKMDLGIRGKCALVTGSIGGIGHATLRALAAQGCNVMMHGLGDLAEIEQKRRAVAEEFGVKVAFNGSDLSKPDQIEELVRATERDLGSIEILVNNAAIRNMYPIEEMPPERWDYALAVNLSAPFHLIRLILPGMKRRQWGRIVNIASKWGLTGTTNRADYVVTKHGIMGLTRAVALEALPYHVTCNAICPGLTLTPHAERQIQERMARSGENREDTVKIYLSERQPSLRLIMPEQIGDLIAFLCSNAASEMTGSPISIDGGWNAL
jgi:3-hydroxybutyrate dehydrogenase